MKRRTFLAGAAALPFAARGLGRLRYEALKLTPLPGVEFKDGALVALNGCTLRCDTVTFHIDGRVTVSDDWHVIPTPEGLV
jgi:hypothetical protein